jgi:hypothetical protein
MTLPIRVVPCLLLTMLSAPSGAQALKTAPIQSIAVSELSSQLDCTIYEESSGTDTTVTRSRSGVYADPFAVVGVNSTAQATFSTWKTWYVKDCVDHFPSLKLSLRSALAAARMPLNVTSGKADFYLSGALSATSSENGPLITDSDTKVTIKYNRMKIFFNFEVRNSRGKVVYGDQVQASIDEDFQVSAMGTTIKESRSGEGLYGKLEQNMARIVARKIALRLKPIKPISVDEDVVVLNYGDYVLPVGSKLQATNDKGFSVFLNVVSSDDVSSVANVDGDGSDIKITPDWRITFVEKDSLNYNGRRFRRNDLP